MVNLKIGGFGPLFYFMDIKEKIDIAVAEVEASTDFGIVSEIKAALNTVYGEGRNQITKPSYESIMMRAKETGIEAISRRHIEQSQPSEVASYLRAAIGDSLSYQIIIHFPEVTIRNDSHKHLIRDIYVRAFLKPSGLISPYLQGIRATLTEAEFVSQYIHSHLPRLNAKRITFHPFCTGIGEINQVLALLNTKYSSANFMMFLMHIKNFLEWESKEGHPHMHMENVFTRSDNMSHHNALSDYHAEVAGNEILNTVRTKLTVSEVMRMFNFEVTERGIRVDSTIDLEKWMAGIIEEWDVRALFSTSNHSLFLSLRDNTGVYYSMQGMRPNIDYEKEPILNFKGRDIKFEVIERSQKQIHETFANPKITKEACKKLSRILTKTALTTPGIKSGSALIYNTGVTGSDKVSVQGDMDRGVVGDALLSN